MWAYLLRRIYDLFRTISIMLGSTELNRCWYKTIDKLNIDISDQYSNSLINTDYLKFNVRMMHAFQMQLFNYEFKCPIEFKVMDFGDSAGTHSQYIKRIWSQAKTLSVNIDREAVKKIRNKWLNAVLIKKEEDFKGFEKQDYVISFEVFEHLENPITVLKSFKEITDKVIITVPYLEQSRVVANRFKTPENCHIFELCPDDWKALFDYTGWKIDFEDVYYQYPRRIPIISWLLKKYWQKYDFEGFYGVVLEKR